MYARTISASLRGVEAEKIVVESDIAFGFPTFSIVGLPDTAIRESKERVRTAIVNSGYAFPDRRVTVNLSPANVRKEGSHLDLSIAVCVLEASGVICSGSGRRGVAFLGELALDGQINRVNGALPLLLGLLEQGVETVLLPEGNRGEAELVPGAEVYAVSSLRDVTGFLNGTHRLAPVRYHPIADGPATESAEDYLDVAGQQTGKRVLQIAAAAMHNVLLTGPPGSGKTMLARRLPGILPPLTYEEMLEVTKIYSCTGLLSEQNPLVRERPFRAPDHTISAAALIGGGARARAGEVSLAHLGVLFLDELPEFSRRALEALRKPMEDEETTVSRLTGSVTFPSKFLLVGAMNPCPCGYYGCGEGAVPVRMEGETAAGGPPYHFRTCTCTHSAVMRYRQKLSGPLLDRFDLFVHVSPLPPGELHSSGGRSSAAMREEVLRARAMQDARFADEPIRYNSQMTPAQLRRYCAPDNSAQRMLDQVYMKQGMSMRGYNRVLRVARTIADLDGREQVAGEDVAEAISYRLQEGFATV